MATASLEATIQKLVDQLKATELKCAKLEGETSRTTSVVYQTKPDKTLKKFKPDDDIDDWIECTESYISRFKTDAEKVDMILHFLDSKPYAEVRFRIDRSRTSSKQIFEILKEVYGLKETWSQLQQQFYSRQQEVGESLEDFSYALMEIMRKMEKMNPSVFQNADELLRERFAEGVHKISLRREMRRLNKERSKLKFCQLRDEAIAWNKDEESKAEEEPLRQESVSSTAEIDQLKQAIQEQQQEIHKLGETVYKQPQQQSTWSRGRSRGWRRGSSRYRFRDWNRGQVRGRGQFNHNGEYQGEYVSYPKISQNKAAATGNQQQDNRTNLEEPMLCYYCKQPNHVERFCIKKRRDQRAHSTNYYHSK
jgi:hypothetical protein